MAIYVVKMVDNFDTYLSANNFTCLYKNVQVEADNEDEAKAKANADHPEWNAIRVTTIEKIAMQEAEWQTKMAKEEAKRERKIANEKAKAEAMGMTEEEYKKEVNRKRNLRKAEREVERLEAELLEAKKKLEYYRGRA